MPLAGLLVLLSSLAAGPAVKVELLEGAPLQGNLLACSADGVVVEVGGASQKIAVDKVLSIDLIVAAGQAPVPPSPQIELIDGSRFSISGLTIAQGEGSVSIAEGQKLAVRSRAMKWVRLKAPEPALEKNWQDLLATKTETDLLIVRKKNEQGMEFLDGIDGVVEGVTEDKVNFVFSGETTNVPRTKVEGIVFFQPPGRELPDLLGQIQEAGGARWSTRSMELKGDSIEFTTVAGPRHVRPISAVIKIDFSTGKLLRLVDLTPESDTFLPVIAGKSPLLTKLHAAYAQAHNRIYTSTFTPKLPADGGELPAASVQGAPLMDGMSMLGGTTRIYALPGKYRRFTTTVVAGVSSEDLGQLRILGDTKVLYEGEFKFGQAPVSLDLDLTNVRRLKIYVVDKLSRDKDCYIYLCRPRIWK